jgi:hypothetical protein
MRYHRVFKGRYGLSVGGRPKQLKAGVSVDPGYGWGDYRSPRPAEELPPRLDIGLNSRISSRRRPPISVRGKFVLEAHRSTRLEAAITFPGLCSAVARMLPESPREIRVSCQKLP